MPEITRSTPSLVDQVRAEIGISPQDDAREQLSKLALWVADLEEKKPKGYATKIIQTINSTRLKYTAWDNTWAINLYTEVMNSKSFLDAFTMAGILYRIGRNIIQVDPKRGFDQQAQAVDSSMIKSWGPRMIDAFYRFAWQKIQTIGNIPVLWDLEFEEINNQLRVNSELQEHPEFRVIKQKMREVLARLE